MAKKPEGGNMIKPLRDYVVLEAETAKKNVGGFILPESKEKPSVAKVVAVGPGKTVEGTREEIPLKTGDRVIYKEYSTTEYKDQDSKYLLIKAEDIIAIIE